MPGLTGLELVLEIKKIRKNLPVILCTGYGNSFSKTSAKKMGINDFMTKPFLLKELSNSVYRVLGETKD